MTNPSDAAIAQAFREAQAMYAHAGGSYDTRMIESRASEIQSASPALPHSGVDDAMVERTAKAIFAGMHPLWDWNLCPESHNESRRIARAALLAAVREGK